MHENKRICSGRENVEIEKNCAFIGFYLINYITLRKLVLFGDFGERD